MISFEVFLPVIVIVMIKLGKNISSLHCGIQMDKSMFIPIFIVEFYHQRNIAVDTFLIAICSISSLCYLFHDLLPK